MRNNAAKKMAVGGLMAALAVVVMSMGTLIPVATFVCPMLCMIILQLILKLCGSRVAWAWYGVVALLSLLLAPDKEAAAVFLFIGYYPILKPKLDSFRFGIVLKLALFNCAMLLMYWVLIRFFGMDQIAREYEELGFVMTAVLLILGNVTFFLLDVILGRKLRRRKHG